MVARAVVMIALNMICAVSAGRRFAIYRALLEGC